MLLVPEYRLGSEVLEPSEIDREDEYVANQLNHLSENLGLEPIVTKSFAQLSQVLWECILAIERPNSYFEDSAESSLRYGYRFHRALNHSYEAIGLSMVQESPEGSQITRLSDKLHAALVSDRGPVTILDRAANSLSSHRLKRFDLREEKFRGEKFAFFLWLRMRSEDSEGGGTVPYKLRLMGTSAYAHREFWSQRIDIDVWNTDGWLPAKAAFAGRPLLGKIIDERRDWLLWKTMLAVPIRVDQRIGQRHSRRTVPELEQTRFHLGRD